MFFYVRLDSDTFITHLYQCEDEIFSRFRVSALGEVPESPRLVAPPEQPTTSFMGVAPTAATAFQPMARRQESRIEEVLAQRLDVSPGGLRDGLRPGFQLF